MSNNEELYNGIEVEDINIYPHVYDSIKVAQKIIEPTELMLPILDSVIETINHCPAPYYGIEMPLKIDISVRIQDSRAYMYLYTIRSREGEKANAIFNYRDYDFTYSGKILENLFFNTGELAINSYPDLTSALYDIDDRAYQWRLIIENSTFKWLFVKNCDFSWRHELFDSLWVY